MKNFISLSLVALIFLCGCKSNSFMTQRYTKLGHTPSKHPRAEVNVVKKNKEARTDNSQTTAAPNETGESILACSDALILPVKKVNPSSGSSFTPKKIIDPFLRTGNRAVSMMKAEVKKSGTQKVTGKKTFREKAQAAAGLLNTVFKIVMFAIILAIIVALIILVIVAG